MNNNAQDIIKDAFAVRDDGAQPRFEAAEYEACLLGLARRDEGYAENGIAQALARIAAGTNEEANALIFAADRKRDAEAAASVGKSARVEKVTKAAPSSTSLDAILDEAQSVLSKGATPTVTRDVAESAMIELAKREARGGEGVCDAYARLCESDARMQKLYALGQAADTAEVERVEQLSKRTTKNERVWN